MLLLLSLQFSVKAQTSALNSYPSAPIAIFLDFDGHYVEGTSWNWDGNPFACAASGLNASQILEVFNRVAEDFRPFNINITTDPAIFLASPIDKRMRVVITTTSSWYGNGAGGVSFMNTFTSGDDTPCFVFSALFGYNLKKIAEAVSHEAGHTLGLYHQSQYDNNCKQITEYYAGAGTGEIGWAPIMGVGYNRNFTLWANGPSSLGCSNYQSDLDIITSLQNGFGYRPDDYGNSFSTAAQPLFANNQFTTNGVIQQNTDQDMFHFTMPYKGRLQLDAIPYNVGTGNAGSDLDMQVTLYNASEQFISAYNPGALLNSVADTILDAGNYFLKVEGKGNLYAPAYASLGSYSLNATIGTDILLPLHKLELRGMLNGDKHQFTWVIEADEQLTEQLLEISIDGKEFTPLTEIPVATHSYFYHPAAVSADTKYRIKATFDDGHRYYSNIVTIRENEVRRKPQILANFIASNTISVSSPGNYNYTLVDFTGKMVSRGQLINGINTISVRNMVAGMYIIRMANNEQQWTEKIVRY